MTIRAELPGDLPRVRALIAEAFGGEDESILVERLHAEGAVLGSYVAEHDGVLVGHVLFSRMFIDHAPGSTPAVALAPLAVVPARQRAGIGGALVRYGLERLRDLGESIVIVLGHPGYYPRFGFSTAAAAALESPFRRESFMALELTPFALRGVSGRVRYAAAFGL